MNNEKGVILLAVVLVITVVSIYMASYSIWAVYDQRNLMRQIIAEKANSLALAGLGRMKLALFLETDSWLDGEISGINITVPDSNAPNTFYPFNYANNTTSLGQGNYTVEIAYLPNPRSCVTGCSFYDKKALLRSTGSISTVQGSANRTLNEIISCGAVDNYNQAKLYNQLQTAVDEAASDDNIRVTGVVLSENVTIDSGSNKNFNITGVYDESFKYRNNMNYLTAINGTVAITNNANVTMSGVEIR